MLKVSSVSKAYGGDPVLREVSFILNDGECVGLIGPNGSGKSTLLKVIAGDLETDSGSVWIDPSDAVAYLPQYPEDDVSLTVGEALLSSAGEAGRLQKVIRQLEQRLAVEGGETQEKLLTEYGRLSEEFERRGGYRLEARMKEVVTGLALDVTDFESSAVTLSGGNKTKLSLAGLLLSEATILLLDEPTNFLDLKALLWLERFVTEGNRSLIIVSHDRRFLDRTVTRIVELDQMNRSIRVGLATTAITQRHECEKSKSMWRHTATNSNRLPGQKRIYGGRKNRREELRRAR